jgi:flagellin-specific chaperone FliS
MNTAYARAGYAKTLVLTETDEVKNAKAIMIALTQLISSLEDLLNSEKPEDRDQPLEIALSRIYLLQKCLDFDQGRELAVNLFKVYEFTRQSLLKFKADGETRKSLQNSLEYITLISEGWEEVLPTGRK